MVAENLFDFTGLRPLLILRVVTKFFLWVFFLLEQNSCVQKEG